MSWIVSLLSALLCGVAGLLLAGFIANACVVWYHVSSFEGGSGYYVVFLALLGGLVGSVTGLVASRIVAARGGGTGSGIIIPLGTVVLLAAIVAVLAWLGGDVPPRLHGDRINLVLELRAPHGWNPANRIRAGGNWIVLTSIGPTGITGHSSSGSFEWTDARRENGSWLLTMETSVFTTSGRRGVTVTLGHEDVASFIVPLPGRPDESYESWSEWLPKTDDPAVAGGFRYRFRVRPANEAAQERVARDEARREEARKAFEGLSESAPLEEWLTFLGPEATSDQRTRAGEVVTRRPSEVVALIASPDLAIASKACSALHWFYPPPEGVESALRVMLGNIGASTRAWHASLDTSDPDLLGASELNERYVAWESAWDKIVTDGGAPLPPELIELRDDVDAILAEPGMQGATDLDLLASFLHHNLTQWYPETGESPPPEE